MKCTFSLAKKRIPRRHRRLKSSKLPEQAAAAEQRHREEVEAETQKALAQKERRNQVGRVADGRMGGWGDGGWDVFGEKYGKGW